mmetsp:Transcript_914/g.1438  ORF Transcript_914/g.1438 Transcript_914/m.1438 type:complete len:263 (+) Transcript_914:185-973(+)
MNHWTRSIKEAQGTPLWEEGLWKEKIKQQFDGQEGNAVDAAMYTMREEKAKENQLLPKNRKFNNHGYIMENVQDRKQDGPRTNYTTEKLLDDGTMTPPKHVYYHAMEKTINQPGMKIMKLSGDMTMEQEYQLFLENYKSNNKKNVMMDDDEKPFTWNMNNYYHREHMRQLEHTVKTLEGRRDMIRVHIRCMNGQHINLMVNQHASILDVKLLIQQRKNINLRHQRLVFQGSLCGDNQYLYRLGVIHNTTLQLIIQMRGGHVN